VRGLALSLKTTCVALLILVGALLPAAAPAAGGSASAALDVTFHSVALDADMHALVFLPAGYRGSTTRYPVIYFLHGLPAAATTYSGNKWLDAALDASGKPAILVEPQGARGKNSDAEYLNWGPGDNWEDYVSGEVPAYIDSHFRTIASRQGRALVGLSAGGYGAVILGIHHLDRFAAIESWSGYFHPTDPTGTIALDRGSDADAHAQIASLKAREAKLPTFLAFYVGRGDSRFRAENVQFDQELTAAHVPHRFAVYPGGHTSSLWYAHAEGWLTAALNHLAPPSTDP
jgi:enterochelin esterase-like enzyme